MQQRLQESAVSLTVASDDSQDVESGASNQTPSQDNPTGTSPLSECVCVCVCVRARLHAPEIIFQVRTTVRMVSCGRNCGNSANPTWTLW
jgi:hypothetical protein